MFNTEGSPSTCSLEVHGESGERMSKLLNVYIVRCVKQGEIAEYSAQRAIIEGRRREGCKARLNEKLGQPWNGDRVKVAEMQEKEGVSDGRRREMPKLWQVPVLKIRRRKSHGNHL